MTSGRNNEGGNVKREWQQGARGVEWKKKVTTKEQKKKSGKQQEEKMGGGIGMEEYRRNKDEGGEGWDNGLERGYQIWMC